MRRARRAALAAPAIGLAIALAALGAPRAAPAAAAGPADSIDLVVPRYLVAGGGPGTVIAQVRDAEGQPAADGISVTFTASLDVAMRPIVALTEGGQAVASAAPGSMAGFAQITALAGDARDDQLLWVRPGPAARVTMLLAEPAIVPFAGAASVALEAVDAYGHAAEGDAVAWSIEGGTLDQADARIAAGIARAGVSAAPGADRMVVGVAVGGARGTLVVPVRSDGAPWRAFLPLARRAGIRAP